jgi:hypothetical protein
MELIPVPSALMSCFLLAQEPRHKQAGIPHRGRSAEIDYHTKLKMKTEPNKRFLDYDKGIPELLNDLDELSQRCGENAATNE